jgi:hypothetical protein
MASFDRGFRMDSGVRFDEPSNPKNKMSKLRRDLKGEPVPNKTTRGTEIVTACTGNAALGDITAELAAFNTANGALKTTAGDLGAAQASVTSLAAQQTVDEAAWDAKFETLCLKIEVNTTGNKIQMGTSTIATYDPGVSSPAPGTAQVLALSTSISDILHALDLHWNAVRPKPLLYLVFMCEGAYDPAKMVQIGTPSASQFTATGLLPGHTYWFQVCAVGTGDRRGPLSDPAMGMAV